ncbi:NADP-dependent oxidoreductase [Pokkaliibacter sp. MBI-7]|uniref:NADP-dependent oxidoreductase n=1 Tax=Pokkaliibacter sp. MBI-7 TaxID=3040600 RepID=UPI0024495C6C|nr:NADP-dependent oxidoreductase [Pokkaliibacter sp. MBI-7]MDH2432882.1 NADP-dependent oxidoreductase [Pokkaliibacter sp. MBI-7]
MKAIQIHAFGGADVLQIDELPSPLLEADHVIVRSQAAGVNPIDWKTREGGGVASLSNGLPLILGWEMAGVVESASSEVTIFQPGDEVMGLLNFPQPGRCYAEEVSANAAHLVHKPDNISFAEAAALPLAGLTAWQALHDYAHLRAGQRVLILAAAGGVGHLAVQFAKQAGAEVIAVASERNHDYLRQLGADACIDYWKVELKDAVRDVDIVLDGVGGSSGVKALAVLKHDGVLVTLPSKTAEEVVEAASQHGYRATGMRVFPSADQLQEIADLVEAGKVRVEVSTTFPFQQVREAHQLSASGRVRGKIVLTF